ncbi:hypothetical protein BHU72_08880 [Desulfuribacillus stibiiarsenatis]|uniref:Uncharacterized protein n=1 Tax=Desulfuribacillus stibiiarsenatis TaxID=1390249 RepID=A0A1E5L3F6_9FIRM|nr:hypothetical protein [Desulfuribacillus stibiiarsenatis]OEH84601.1 hypothetical protein BHU72_08880 [Desulfuribacillus stibiiarsenatis]
MTDEQLLLQLRNAMGTDSNGRTPVNNIASGMETFARQRGVSTAMAFWIDPPTWSGYKSGINNDQMLYPLRIKRFLVTILSRVSVGQNFSITVLLTITSIWKFMIIGQVRQ